MYEDEKDVAMWFERVESFANPADAPSRSTLDELTYSFRIRWVPEEEFFRLDPMLWMLSAMP